MIYGTAWKGAQTEELVRTALVNGFRAFDTANMPKHYSESGVGDALRQSSVPREQLWVQTKFTRDACVGESDTALHPFDPAASISAQVRQSFASSLSHLGSAAGGYVDSYLLHSPFAVHADTMEAWREMEALHREGLVSMIGVSNFDEHQLADLLEEATVKPSSVQNRCTAKAGGGNWDSAVRALCRQHGVAYQAFWLLSNDHLLSSVAVADAAGAHGATREEVVYRFAQQGLGVVPLSGPKQTKHMRLALDTESAFTLSEAELSKMEEVKSPTFDSTNPVVATFHNGMQRPMSLYWVRSSTAYSRPCADDDSSLVLQATVPPGHASNVNTFPRGTAARPTALMRIGQGLIRGGAEDNSTTCKMNFNSTTGSTAAGSAGMPCCDRAVVLKVSQSRDRQNLTLTMRLWRPRASERTPCGSFQLTHHGR
jgi:diketogulonate reductase-like aldo/keto reductase